MPIRDMFPSGGRFNACVILAIGAVLFGLDAVSRLTSNGYYPFVWLFGPGCIAVGTAGLIDPRIALAVSPEARTLDLPRWARVLGPALLFGGFIAGWLLMDRFFK